jgi:hypothetical protein
VVSATKVADFHDSRLCQIFEKIKKKGSIDHVACDIVNIG